MSSTVDNSPTRTLAAFATDLQFEQIPQEVIEHAKLCLLDSVGCAFYGANSQEARIVVEVVRDWSTKPESSIWVHGLKTACANAALANSTMVNSFTLDDSHRGANIKCSAVLVPAALSVAERIGSIDGKSLLTALVAGYEVSIHVGMSMCPNLQLRGYHPVGSVGGFGAAAAAGKLLGLNTDQMVHAFGIVGTQGGGLMAGQFDSMVKRMHGGKAAQNGVFSAFLAAQGFKGIANILEAEYGGFCKTLSDECDMELITKGLGTDFETLNIYFRRYCCSGATLAAVDAILELIQEVPIEVENVKEIVVRASEVTVKHNGWPYSPVNAITAQSNMAYGVAVGLLEGDAFVDQFTETKLSDPKILELTRKVRVVTDEEITRRGQKGKHNVKIEVHLKDGQSLIRSIDKARSVKSDEVMDKFKILAEKVVDQSKMKKIAESIMELEDLPDIGLLVRSIS
jgi:2-methylcitrate dehydratase PrpD